METISVQHINDRLIRAYRWWGEDSETPLQIRKIIGVKKQVCKLIRDFEWIIYAEAYDGSTVEITTWYHWNNRGEQHHWVAEVTG